MFLLSRIVDLTHGVGVFQVDHGEEVPLAGVADLALRAERGANAAGARLLGFEQVASVDDVLQHGDALLVVGDLLRDVSRLTLERASVVLYVGTTAPAWCSERAAVILPMANTLEEEGTLTNLRGRVQRFLQAKAAPGVARPSWYVLADMVVAVGGDAQYFTPADVFDALVAARPPFAGLHYEDLGLRGQLVAGEIGSAAVADGAV